MMVAALLLGVAACIAVAGTRAGARSVRDSLLSLDQSRTDSVAARVRSTACSRCSPRRDLSQSRHADRLRTRAAASLFTAAPDAVLAAVSGKRLAAACRGISARHTRSVSWTTRDNGTKRRFADAHRAIHRVLGARTRPAVARCAYAEVGAPALPEVPLSSLAQATAPRSRLAGRVAEVALEVRAADSLFADLGDRMGLPFAFSNTVAPHWCFARSDAARRWSGGRARAVRVAPDGNVADVEARVCVGGGFAGSRLHSRRIDIDRTRTVGRRRSAI